MPCDQHQQHVLDFLRIMPLPTNSKQHLAQDNQTESCLLRNTNSSKLNPQANSQRSEKAEIAYLSGAIDRPFGLPGFHSHRSSCYNNLAILFNQNLTPSHSCKST